MVKFTAFGVVGVATFALALGACGGEDAGGTGAGGAGAGAGSGATGSGATGSGGSGATGSGGSGATGSGGMGGEGATGVGGAGTGGSPNGCDNNAKSATSGNLIVAQVSWPAKTGIEAGKGTMYIWTKSVLSFGDPDPSTGEIEATGEAQPCGSIIPELTKTGIAGGGKVQTVIPNETWDKPSMPKIPAKGKLSGFDIGATVSMDPIVSLVGLTMSDPQGPWPSSAKAINAVDHDGDGQPGILAKPRTDPPYSAPPTSLFEALNANGKRATEVYVVTRTMIQLGGTRDTCTSATGNATVYMFDNHVVGCKRNDGKICTQAESDFIDQNQPKFTVQSATYEMVQLPEGASCADVRTALPAN